MKGFTIGFERKIRGLNQVVTDTRKKFFPVIYQLKQANFDNLNTDSIQEITT